MKDYNPLKNIVKSQGLKKVLATLFIASALSFPLNKNSISASKSPYENTITIQNERRINNIISKIRTKTLEDLTIEIGINQSKIPLQPKLGYIPSEQCSRYAKEASKLNYGTKWPSSKAMAPKHKGKWQNTGDAWNLQYFSPTESIPQENPYRKLDSLSIVGNLKPGMLVLVHNPKSKWNKRKDLMGNPIETSHAILYVGRNKNGEMQYQHQWGSKRMQIDHEWMLSKKLIPKKIVKGYTPIKMEDLENLSDLLPKNSSIYKTLISQEPHKYL